MMRLSDGSLLLQPVSVSVGTTAVVDPTLQQMLMESSQHLPEAIEFIKQSGEGTSHLGPDDIRFTQDSISQTFKDGSSVDDLINGLKNGTVNPDDIPAIRIYEQDGVIYSLDNRRLYAFQEAGVENINYQWATAEEIANEAWKFTTENGGTSIRVRGQ